MKICVLFLFLMVTATLSAGDWFTAYYDPATQAYSVRPGKDLENGVVWAEYAQEVNKTGWARFNLESSAVYGDNIQSYAAGYLEGYVTAELIWQSWYNFVINSYKGTVPSALIKWFNANVAWVENEISKSASRDIYWAHADLVMRQVYGMKDGYNYAMQVANKKSQQLDLAAFLIQNGNGDLETISQLPGMSTPPATLQEQFQWIVGTHCSSIVKVTDDLSELFAGHTTWTDFYQMLRIFKSYTLRYSLSLSAQTTLFSSYPGIVSSIDDFYQLSSKLVVMETTNGCYNQSLIRQFVKPDSVLSWLRIVLSNRLAKSATDWVSIFTRYNSGTYNNQWIVVDYNKFVPYQPLVDNTLVIAEQLPGDVITADVTQFLRLGYWPSFNIPFFTKNYDICEFPKLEQEFGTWFTYDLSPRGEIFRRDANKIKSLVDTRNFLRYNDWAHDLLSAGSPGNQISSRFDLVSTNAHPVNPYLVRNAFGGIDSKATSWQFVQRGVAYAQSGPTLGGAKETLPAFEWSKWSNITHAGLPEVFNFPWVTMPGGATNQ